MAKQHVATARTHAQTPQDSVGQTGNMSEMVGEPASPAGTVAQVIFQRLGQVPQHEIELGDALLHEVFHHVLHEGAIEQRQHGQGPAALRPPCSVVSPVAINTARMAESPVP